MPTATAHYLGQLRTEATHVASGTVLLTDAPVDNHGKGEAFSPTDLVCVALASCIVTTMGIVADRHGLGLAGSTYATTKHMSTDAPRRIVRIEVALQLPAALAAADRALMERTARTCPVALSLHPDVDKQMTFSYEL